MANNFLKNKKVLITYGPTWVPIDEMRVISNQSSGQLGKLMASDFRKAGAEVTVIEGPIFDPIKSKSIKVIKFAFYDEFLTNLKKELKKKYAIVIHAAAVSDYRLKKPFKTKISSNQKRLRLDLVPTPKVINQIKKINPHGLLVGFKLESALTRKGFLDKTKPLFQEAECDFVVANHLNSGNYLGYLIDKDFIISEAIESRESMSQFLVNTLKEYQR